MVLEDGRTLAESDAILTFFGEGTRYMPQDKYLRAKMFEWMFFEQNYHEGTIAVRAAILNYSHRAHQKTPEQLQSLLESGNRVLGVMEAQLAKTPYIAGDAFTLADIAVGLSVNRWFMSPIPPKNININYPLNAETREAFANPSSKGI